MRKLRCLLVFTCIAVLLQACSLGGDTPGLRVRCIRNIEQQEDGYTELAYRFFYTADGRIGRVEEVSRKDMAGMEASERTVIYRYTYMGDTLYLSCEVWGEDRPTVRQRGKAGYSAYAFVFPLDETGKVVSLNSPEYDWQINYTYDGNGRLIASEKSYCGDGDGSSELLAEIGWTETGDLHMLKTAQQSFRFEYEETPLSNTLNLDFLFLFLENSYLQQIPLWCVGLQGSHNRSLPVRMECAERQEELNFSYKTDGRRITGFMMKYPDQREAFWEVEYE